MSATTMPSMAPPAEQPISVPRRPLDFEDYIDILRRHRSWILGPAFLGLVFGVVTAFLWEDSYVARGKIRITPPQIPARFVPGNVGEEMTARINAIAQEIITRSSLQNLIQTYNLYPDDRKRLPMEDVIDKMRRAIGIDNIQSYGRSGAPQYHVFTVSFVYSDRRLAQKICAELIDRFTKQSIESRLNSSRQTTLFLSDQYEAAKRELDEIDARGGRLADQIEERRDTLGLRPVGSQSSPVGDQADERAPRGQRHDTSAAGSEAARRARRRANSAARSASASPRVTAPSPEIAPRTKPLSRIGSSDGRRKVK